MEKILDFNELFFGDLEEYKKLIVGLLESLKVVSPTTLWSITEDTEKGLSTIVTLDIMNLIIESLDMVSNNLYSNDIITQAPKHVLDEYDNELDSFLIKFEGYKDEFMRLHE